MIFLLKLLGKIVKLCVKLLLLPFRLVLRLVRGSSDDSSSGGGMVASAATSAATAAASSAAATADEARDRQAESTAQPEQRVDPSVLTNYERFRKALYAYAGFGALLYVFLWAEFSAPIGALMGPLAIGLGVPVALGYWAHTESRLAWGAGMAYAGLFLLLSVAGVAGLANLGSSATRAFNDLLGGGTVMILGAFSLLQMGSLAAALYFGATGRAVALGASTAVAEPSTGGSDAAAVEDPTRDGSDGADGAATEQSTGTASEQRSGTPAASERTEPSTADAGGAGTEPTATDTGSAPTGTTDVGTTAAEPTDATMTAAGAADGETTAAEATDAEAAAESEEEAEGDTAPVVEGLAEEVASTRDPADIRELGDRIDEDPVPDEVITALETCAEADDPDVRVAVCDACAEIPGDAVESILGRLRIDTNDRVATAAMEAY